MPAVPSITATSGAYCPVPPASVRAKRLRSGKYRLGSLGLEIYCPRCADYWPADTEFFFPANRATGLNTYCKACFIEWRAERRKKAAA